jgi:hypothetical protein
MTRRATLLIVLLLSAAAAARLSAHDDFRIIGTLEKVQDREIAVKEETGRVVSIGVSKQTTVKQDKQDVTVAALKVGQTVVVDAYGDSKDDALALEIRIVPPIKRGRK